MYCMKTDWNTGDDVFTIEVVNVWLLYPVRSVNSWELENNEPERFPITSCKYLRLADKNTTLPAILAIRKKTFATDIWIGDINEMPLGNNKRKF